MVLSSPPRPKFSVLSQTRRFFEEPFDLLSEVRQNLGDIFSLHILGLGRCVVFCRPDHLAEIYKLESEALAPGAIRYKLFASIVGDQISLGMDGDRYKRRRRQLTPFFGHRQMMQHTDNIRLLTEATLQGWSVGQTVQLQAELDRLALRVISRILFGDTEASIAEDLVRRAGAFLKAIKSPFVQTPFLRLPLGSLTPWGHYTACRRQLFEALRQEIRRRGGEDGGGVHGDRNGDDLLAKLTRSSLEDDPAQQLEAIVQEMAGLLIGGSETTSKAIGWTFLGLAKNPTVQNRLRQEIVEVLGRSPLRQEDIARMPYLDAVVKEGLRWQPVAPLVGFRRVERPIEIAGFHIPAGHIVAQATKETSRHEAFAQPETFDPDNHFLKQKNPLNRWLPFGGGQRVCIGMALAQLEMAVVLATVLQHCRLEISDQSTRPQQSGIAFQPTGGLPARISALTLGAHRG